MTVLGGQSWVRNLTDDQKHLRSAYVHDAPTRACIEKFFPVIDSFFDGLDPPVPADPDGHTHRCYLTDNIKREQVRATVAVFRINLLE